MDLTILLYMKRIGIIDIIYFVYAVNVVNPGCLMRVRFELLGWFLGYRNYVKISIFYSIRP